MRAAAIGSCPRSAFSVLVRLVLAAGSKMSYSPVSPCRLLTSMLPMDYLTPDVAHAVPKLPPPEDAQTDPAPSAMACGSSRAGRLSP